ncbi:MAG TPA: D-glycero-beta-D-manno-heptose 1,7-bisphosphate 7-phosphatase [Steroidobacteraceae bacterium]|jgi:D-glycero-D-manno-heptose 1,7-bisphosphate phosphatase
MNVRHLILDRDGVLNREAPDAGYILRPQDFHWLPGALEALALLHQAGVRLSVATNQSAVGRGLMDQAGLESIHSHMRAEAQACGGPLSAVLYCPHAPQENCDCRKPAPGLILAAMRQSAVPAAQTLLVGDDVRDIEAARAAGVAAVLVRTGKGEQAQERLRASGVAILVYDSLLDLAHRLVDGESMNNFDFR